MYIKVPLNASPFPVSNLVLHQSSFRNNLVQGAINKHFALERGWGNEFSVIGALYSSIGEYLERLTQTNVSHKLKIPFVNAYNTKTEKTEKVPIEDVLLFDPKIFDSSKESKWNDSCGAAFHINSKDLIESSFFEFIERQSFIYNWLTQSPGKKVDINEINKFPNIFNMVSLLNSYFENFEFYEISLHECCYVVISIGIGEDYKSVGLGVGWTLSEAVFSSMKENLQGITHMIPKHHMDIHPNLLEKLNRKEKPKNVTYYAEIFDEITPTELKEKFSYLRKGNLMVEDRCVEGPSYKEFLPIFNKVSKDLSIEILICYIPSIIEDLPGNVIRMIGKGAFPHMKTDELNSAEYTINGINKLPQTKVPNMGKMIPFN